MREAVDSHRFVRLGGRVLAKRDHRVREACGLVWLAVGGVELSWAAVGGLLAACLACACRRLGAGGGVGVVGVAVGGGGGALLVLLVLLLVVVVVHCRKLISTLSWIIGGLFWPVRVPVPYSLLTLPTKKRL